MNSNSTDDEMLRGYLLGELTEEEADAVEGRLLMEDELFELSEAIESDLLAEYAQGSLAPAERELVRQRLAASPQGRERLMLARSLNVLAAREKAAVLPFVPRTAPSRQPALRWAALAAGLLAAAGLAWFTREQSHIVHQENRPAPVIAETPRAHEVPAPPRAPVAPSVAPAPQPVKAVFQLALTSLRGSESVEKLRVPTRAGTVELQISVEGMEDLQSFHLTVRNGRAETVKAWTALKPKDLNGVRALVVDLPAELLPAGKYEIQAQGIAPGGEPEDLSPLEVEVVKEGNG
ncbi:MAG: hypothetical protein DMF53_08810 [Acidobacteria bacterium]|nr:MAG: hypothetical protein DMF53_08810 [Acidobacteriota bacterium]